MTDGFRSRAAARAAAQQRARRARMTRIDYMPGDQALAVITAKRAKERPGSQATTNSAVIDAIVTEWAALTGILLPVRARAYESALPEFAVASRPRAPAYDFVPAAAVRPEFPDHSARAYDFGRSFVSP